MRMDFGCDVDWDRYLVRVIKTRFAELAVILPGSVAHFVLPLHLGISGKFVWAP